LRTVERPPIATGEIAAPDRHRLAAVEITGDGSYAVAVLDEFLKLGAVEDADARLRRSVREQQRLEMELIDAVAPLRAGPVAVGALLASDSAGARRQLDARQLRPEHRHAHCYVIAIFRRQPGVADPVGQAEPAKNLHRARRDLVALDVRRLAGTAGLGHGHIDAARGKFHRQCQPDRAGADNQYACIE
jgi:hypothetical protein